MFTGEMRTAWLPDGLLMRVDAAPVFTDAKGRRWTIRPGRVIDGASIPRSLWSITGGPYEGLYRVPAGLHDDAYNTLGVAKLDADLMLLEACLELGCPRLLAEVLYEGVRLGGLAAYAADQRAAAAEMAAGAVGAASTLSAAC